MGRDADDDRVSRKAHELWEAEGRPHGRDEAHWVQAREIIAIQDSQAGTLLPRDSGSEEPIESAEESLRNLADFPNLTDQGENLLTSTDREPSFGGGTGGDIPSVEVPTSGQPGIPAKASKSGAKEATGSGGKSEGGAASVKSAAPVKPAQAKAAATKRPTSTAPKK